MHILIPVIAGAAGIAAGWLLAWYVLRPLLWQWIAPRCPAQVWYLDKDKGLVRGCVLPFDHAGEHVMKDQ